MDALQHFRLHILRLEAGGGGRRVALRRRFNSALRALVQNPDEEWCESKNEEDCENNVWCNWWGTGCHYDPCAATESKYACEHQGCSWWEEGGRCRGVYDQDSEDSEDGP